MREAKEKNSVSQTELQQLRTGRKKRRIHLNRFQRVHNIKNTYEYSVANYDNERWTMNEGRDGEKETGGRKTENGIAREYLHRQVKCARQHSGANNHEKRTKCADNAQY